MRKWFSRIGNRADAIAAIRQTSTALFLIAAFQIVAIGLLLSYWRETGVAAARMPLDDIAGGVILSAIIAILAAFLRRASSRFSALLLLIISAYWFVLIFAINGGAFGGSAGNKINPWFALVALWASGRATLATFRLHGRFARKEGQQYSNAIPNDAPYDVEKWQTLVQYDDDIAMAEARLRPLGQKWLDEFARAYLALNDKRYLPNIFQKIVQAARAEEDVRAQI
jgi:hypothetical protein